MALTGAIFDMDGTLLDSMELWKGTIPAFLRRIGLPLTDAQADEVECMMLEEIPGWIEKNFGIGLEPSALILGINQETEYGYYNTVVPKPGVVETLEKLRDMGVKMVVATATEMYLTKAVLTRLELDQYFEACFTASEYHTSKYEPEIFHIAHEFLGTPKESTWVFEDALKCIRGAKRAGFQVVAVEDSYAEPDKEDILALADRYVERLTDLDLTTL